MAGLHLFCDHEVNCMTDVMCSRGHRDFSECLIYISVRNYVSCSSKRYSLEMRKVAGFQSVFLDHKKQTEFVLKH